MRRNLVKRIGQGTGVTALGVWLIFAASAAADSGWRLTWEEQTASGNNEIRAISMISPSEGWLLYYAGGGNGGVWHTGNGGTTWTNISGLNLCWTMDFSDDGQHGIIGGYGERVYHTSDGGATWSALIDLGGGHLGPIRFVPGSSLTAYAAQHNYNMYKTTDGGASWVTNAATHQYPAFWMEVVDENHIWCGSADKSGRDLDLSTDGFATKTTVMHSVGYPKGSFVNTQVGWLAGRPCSNPVTTNSIRKSTDGGLTWQEQHPTYGGILADVKAFTEDIAVVVGENGTVMFTVDGGESWTDAGYATTIDLGNANSYGRRLDGAYDAATGKYHIWVAGYEDSTNILLHGILHPPPGGTILSIY